MTHLESSKNYANTATDVRREVPTTMKVEANLLRFPLFALHTKGLGQMDGVEIAGTRLADGQETDFRLTVTRNVADVYPGPLSRKVHFALLSIANDRGLPIENPIGFSWRDLVKRMGLAYHGKRIENLKVAIRSTAGIEIRTQSALKGPTRGQYLPDADEQSYKLYQGYAFRNEPKSGTGTWDSNYIWLSDWYLDNLNRLYVAPLDYKLWKTLNENSPIASRLYEFFLFNFSGLAVLRVNYPKLAQFLPVSVQRYASLAERQLDPALALNKNHQILRDFRWGRGKGGTVQLLASAGNVLQFSRGRDIKNRQQVADEIKDVGVRELRNLRSPSHSLVRQFHGAWGNDRRFRPTNAELKCATETIREFGKDLCKRLLPVVVDRMKEQFPSAKTFGASRLYWGDVVNEWQAVAERRERNKLERERSSKIEGQIRREEKDWKQQKNMTWANLTNAERSRIEQRVLNRYSHLGIDTDSTSFQTLCLNECDKDNPEPNGD